MPSTSPIDPTVAAQLREINPDREAVVTWSRFRVGVFRQIDPTSNEETARVLEFRAMDGSEVHQFILDDSTRQDIIDWLSVEKTGSGLVLPT